MAKDQAKTTRTSHVQLPSSSDITQIAAAEMQRPHAPGKDGVRYVSFETIIALCDQLSIQDDFFRLDARTPVQVMEEGNLLLDSLVQRLLNKELASNIVTLLDDCYDYLSESDEPIVADVIFVFGSKTPLRIAAAIDLYHRGLGPTMIISGQGPSYGKTDDISEARRYADAAIAEGVPEAAIIVEEQSITLVDNIRRSLNILDAIKQSISSIIIVNSPYTQRRGWCMWRKYLPDDCPIYRVNCETGAKFARDTWFKNEDGLRVVLGEFIKLRNGVAFDSV